MTAASPRHELCFTIAGSKGDDAGLQICIACASLGMSDGILIELGIGKLSTSQHWETEIKV